MSDSIQDQIRFLRIYAVTSSIVIVVLCTSAFRQTKSQALDELTVGRINVVDADGKLRLVISNKDRMHPGMMDGKMIDRPRPVAGLLNAANKIEDRAEREKAIAKIRAEAPASPRRLFAGKTPDRAATIALSDAAGKPRLTLTVDAAGNPRIEFLDETGKVVSRLPQQ